MSGWCWHNWSEWEDRELIYRGQTRVISSQARRCHKCNKVKIRKM